MRPIRRLLVANRGELVVRIARTCRAMGIRCLALVAADQRGAWWARQADEQVALDGSYLEIEAVLAAAQAAGADAIHPGYGFLAERPDFAEAVDRAGLMWVGPPAPAIRAVGDKASARRLARTVDVPLLPGYDGEDQSDETLRAVAARIGYPVLLKPSAGGGGKGMHVARDAGALADLLAQARREALAAFGDDRLVVERFLGSPRHIEVQVLFDSSGTGIHLYERDCSLQRRHQKVLEEAPAPTIGPVLREQLTGAALRIAAAAGYVGAGTVEFLVPGGPATQEGAAGVPGGPATQESAAGAPEEPAFYFLEMNTRLQVEHPVTELVTKRDLVADQLRIAAGEPLGLRQAEVPLEGHAFEARLYAEDPWHGFLPAGGSVVAARWPALPGTRVDAGVADGDAVATRYDPLLAKLIVYGSDRAEALRRMQEFLETTRLQGATTNLAFLRWLSRLPVVAAADARVDTIERHWPGAEAGPPRVPEWAWRAAADVLAPSPLAGFRINAPRRLRLRQSGEERSIDLDGSVPTGNSSTHVAAGRVMLTHHAVSGTPGGRAPAQRRAASDVEGDGALGAPLHSRAEDGVVVAGEGTAWVDVDGRSVPFRLAPPPEPDTAEQRTGGRGGRDRVLASPMPGTVLSVGVSQGETVEPQQTLVVLEAMKMEHVVPAPAGGRIVRVAVVPGQVVQRGELLVEFE